MGISLLHRKDSLILTTIDIIEELGIQGLTTREIAKRQNVSEATLFRHYKNKNELLLAVLNYYSQFDEDIFQSIQIADLSPVDAMRFYLVKQAEYYQNYPAITSITQLYDVFRYDKDLEAKVKEIKYNRTKMLIKLIMATQEAGEIPKEYDSETLAVIIMGMMRETCLNWRLEKYSFSYKDTIKASLDLFIKTLQENK